MAKGEKLTILILGAGGMLGHVLFHALSAQSGLAVYGTARGSSLHPLLREAGERIVAGVDACRPSTIRRAILRHKPDVVINCIGLIRQRPEGRQARPCIEINARLPHLLLDICARAGIRLIHYSTDCVFDGRKGAPYREDDPPSASDVYGISKYLGELTEFPALTIRTSVIGHELKNRLSLVEWFLAQEGTVKGYRQAIYTGLPACEQAVVLARHILPNPGLSGLFHVASAPVSKFDLLRLIAGRYGKRIAIVPDDTVTEDKRLDAAAFQAATGYVAPPWETLVADMRASWRGMASGLDSPA
jgi:dTDP-4-dehydrorhamnose reductase